MAKSATLSPKFYVGLKGYPLTGLCEGDVRHSTRPMRVHYRPRQWNGAPGDSWLTEADTARHMENEGILEIPKNWPKRTRPLLSGLDARLFHGCVFEARTSGDAQSEFNERFGVNSAQTGAYVVFQAPADAPVGLVNPTKVKDPKEFEVQAPKGRKRNR